MLFLYLNNVIVRFNLANQFPSLKYQVEPGIPPYVLDFPPMRTTPYVSTEEWNFVPADLFPVPFLLGPIQGESEETLHRCVYCTIDLIATLHHVR